MVRIELAVLVVVVLAAGRGNALVSCGFEFGICCPNFPGPPTCNSGLVCDSSVCGVVSPGGGNGGAAGEICIGTCFQPTPTPTSTPTPTPHNLHDNDPCNDSRQCASALCNGGVCAERNPAPAVSNYTAAFIGSVLLLAGLWSVRRVARRR